MLIFNVGVGLDFFSGISISLFFCVISFELWFLKSLPLLEVAEIEMVPGKRFAIKYLFDEGTLIRNLQYSHSPCKWIQTSWSLLQ